VWQASRTKRWLDVSSRNDRFLTCLRFLNVNRYTPKGLNCSTLQLSPEPIAIICLIWGRDLRRHRCFRHHAKPWKPSESYSFTGAACCFAVGIHTKLTDMQTWWMRAVENIDMQSQRVWKPQQQLQHCGTSMNSYRCSQLKCIWRRAVWSWSMQRRCWAAFSVFSERCQAMMRNQTAPSK